MRPVASNSRFSVPSARITSWIAMVRTSRLVQNGTVIRNIQKARVAGGRVAMNQAVGMPKTKVSAVVASARRMDRARIVRCAVAGM